MTQKPVASAEIVALFGDIGDHRVAEVLSLGATHEELQEAAAWLRQQNDVMGKSRHPLSGRAARVYDVVSRDEDLGEDSAAR